MRSLLQFRGWLCDVGHLEREEGGGRDWKLVEEEWEGVSKGV
jgi:hypothetical protein